MSTEVPLVDSGRAQRELGWRARHSGADALRIVTSGPVTRRTRT